MNKAEARMVDVLNDIEEFLEDHSDVRDGSDGPRPNRAMNLLSDLAQARSEWARASLPEGRDALRAKIVEKAMERYRVWKEEHPEGPISPDEPGGMRHQCGYDLIKLCAEYEQESK